MTGVIGTDRDNNLRSHELGSSGFVGGSGTNGGTERSLENLHAPPHTQALRALPDHRGCGALLQDFLASAWRTVEPYMPCIGHAEHAYSPVPSSPPSRRSSFDGAVTPYVINDGMSAAPGGCDDDRVDAPRGWRSLPIEIVQNIGRHLLRSEGLVALARQLWCFSHDDEAAEVQTGRFYEILSAAADLPDKLKAPVLAELGWMASSLDYDAQEAAFDDVMRATEALSRKTFAFPSLSAWWRTSSTCRSLTMPGSPC